MTHSAKQVMFLLTTMLKLGMIQGSCNILYLTQPPSELDCNPGHINQIRSWNLKVECEVAGTNDDFEVFWYHNNTDGIVQRLGKGKEKVLSVDTLEEQFEDITDAQLAYGLKSTLTIGKKLESIEIDFQHYDDYDYQSFYETLTGQYWCQVQQGISNDDILYKRSNTMRLEELSSYTSLPACQRAQSERNVQCADIQTTKSLTTTAITHLQWSTTVAATDYYSAVSAEITSPTPLHSEVDNASTTPLTMLSRNEFSTSSITVTEDMAMYTALSAKPASDSLLINEWEIIIVGLCALVVLIIGIVVMVIFVSIVRYRKKRRQTAGKARLAMTQFDNPTYSSNPDEYMEPIRTKTLDCTTKTEDYDTDSKAEDTSIYYYSEPIEKKVDEGAYVEPTIYYYSEPIKKKVDEDVEPTIYYYSEPIKKKVGSEPIKKKVDEDAYVEPTIYYYSEPIKKKVDEDAYVEPATLMDPVGATDNKAEGLSLHQYQSLTVDTVNYLSIYNLIENHESCSTQRNVSPMLLAMDAILPATEEEYDYVNIKC